MVNTNMEQRSTSYHTRALERGLAILSSIGESTDGVRLSQLEDATGVPKSSLVRLLSVLEQSGYVARVSEEPRYRLGPAVLRLARAERANLNAEMLARPHLQRLAAATDQTSNLGVMQGPTILHVCVAEPSRALRFRSSSGSVDHAYCTGLGKALLAALPHDQLADHLPQEPFPSFTENTPTTVAELRDLLERVRADGFAVDEEERDPGVCCLAVAAEIDEHLRIAVSVAGPAGEFFDSARPELVKEVAATAAAIQGDYALCTALAHLVSGFSPSPEGLPA
jgi:DNA-binding IclR family transcriptional regulator